MFEEKLSKQLFNQINDQLSDSVSLENYNLEFKKIIQEKKNSIIFKIICIPK
jgi:hypothetical protein